MNKDFIELIIQERNGKIYDGKVKSVSSVNQKGPFDILPEHEQFVSTLNSYIIARLEDDNEKRWEIENGILRVKDGVVEIYLGI